MDPKAMFKINYGLFVLAAREGEKDNACIINTLMQVTSTPNRVTITVNKTNYTHDMIAHTGEFTISMLDKTAPFSVFQRFGFQSGRTAEKFEGFTPVERAENGIYHLTSYASAYLSGKIVSSLDLGTHTMFLADVTAGEVLSDVESVTYTWYQDNIKPKPQAQESRVTGWRCRICGFEYNETKGDPAHGIAPGTKFEDLPDDWVCPLCKHPKTDFEKA